MACPRDRGNCWAAVAALDTAAYCDDFDGGVAGVDMAPGTHTATVVVPWGQVVASSASATATMFGSDMDHQSGPAAGIDDVGSDEHDSAVETADLFD